MNNDLFGEDKAKLILPTNKDKLKKIDTLAIHHGEVFSQEHFCDKPMKKEADICKY